MLEQTDYKRVSQLADYFKEVFFDPSIEPVLSTLHDILEEKGTEADHGRVVFPALNKYLSRKKLFRDFIDASNDRDVPTDVYAWILISLSDEKWKDCTTYPEFSAAFASGGFAQSFPKINKQLRFAGAV